MADKAANQGGFIRPQRAAASDCLRTLRNEHDNFKQARAERNAKKNADNLEVNEKDFVP